MKSRIVRLEGVSDDDDTKFDPKKILFNEAMDEENYEDLIKALDAMITLADDKRCQIGTFIAEKLEHYSEPHIGWIDSLKQDDIRIAKSIFDKAVDVLKKYEHLCRILKTDIGCQWLSDKKYREDISEASKEFKEEEEDKKETKPTSSARSVQEVLAQIEKNMVEIEGGTFQIGCEEYDDEKPVHSVSIRPFKISAIPFTQAQYEAIMGTNPSHFKGPDNPVEYVSWNDAQEFCERLNARLSEKGGGKYRLPSESEWENACRAGSRTRYCFGDNDNELEKYAWFDRNSDGKTHPVGQLEPNNWKLYDMHGNVWEWCEDDWHENYADAHEDDSPKIDDPRSGSRVLRGGSWYNNPRHCRSAYRVGNYPNNRGSLIGFRLVLVS
ncbi:MAG: formylglycine-generating enzyme family protein [Candidatus Hatepunaea meridiana]|nr:formylglycine-generating enzyme family protein [Candidatus Hatepunaea meridiana]